MSGLIQERCTACRGDTPVLTAEELETLRHQLDPAWEVGDDGHRLRRRFRFPSFAAAFDRATAVARLAEEEAHHPDLRVGWGYLEVALTTHAVGGLTRNDLILAAKVDALEATEG